MSENSRNIRMPIELTSVYDGKVIDEPCIATSINISVPDHIMHSKEDFTTYYLSQIVEQTLSWVVHEVYNHIKNDMERYDVKRY